MTITEEISPDDPDIDIDIVTVAVPRTLAVGGKLFVRLKVVVAAP